MADDRPVQPNGGSGDQDADEIIIYDDEDVIGEDEQYVPEEGDFEVGDDGQDIIIEGDDEEEGEEEQGPDDSKHVLKLNSQEPIYAVAASHKGELVVCGGGDDRAFLWSLGDSSSTEVAKHDDSIVSVAFSFDDEWVAAGGMDGVITVRNLKKSEEMKLEGPGSEIEWLAWHPKHPIILAGSSDTTTWMFNVGDGGNLMGVFTGHTDVVSCGCFTPNGRRVITGSLDGSLKLWDPNGVTMVHSFSGHGFHEGGVITVIPKSAEEPLVASGGSDGTVCLVRLDTKKIIAKFYHVDPQIAAAQQRNRQGEDEDAEEEEQVAGHSVESLAFCPTLPWLVSGGTDGRVVVWDLAVQAKRSVLVHPDGEAIVRCLFLPQSVKLITACADGKVRRYDIRASTSSDLILSGHRDAILDMALMADGKHVVTASDDGTCRIFAVASS